MLTGLHGIDIITPGTSTVDHIRDLDTERLQDSSSSQTQRQINAFYYVLTLFPPIARLLTRKLFGLLSFQLGVGCLFIDIERTQIDAQIREPLQS